MEKNVPRPIGSYLLVWIGLLILTGLTVTVSGLKLGQFSVLTTIFIATIKGALVILYFMHIKYEDRVFKIMLGLAVLTLTLILVLTFVDISFRQGV